MIEITRIKIFYINVSIISQKIKVKVIGISEFQFLYSNTGLIFYTFELCYKALTPFKILKRILNSRF